MQQGIIFLIDLAQCMYVCMYVSMSDNGAGTLY